MALFDRMFMIIESGFVILAGCEPGCSYHNLSLVDNRLNFKLIIMILNTMPDLNNPLTLIILVAGCVIGGGIIGGIIPFLLHQSTEQVIYTENAPKPIGPYNQAIRFGDLIFISGQIGIDPKTGNITGNISGQTEQVMKNLKAILVESGSDLSHVVQSRIYLTNMSDFTTVNEIYGNYLGAGHPARATVQVSGLPKEALVEIEMVAHI